MQSKPLKFGSLFAGIRGFDLAMIRAGMSPSFSAEIDKNCNFVARRNFPNEQAIADVADVRGPEYRCDVLAAGWPCQGNSVAGRRAGMADERSGLWSEVVSIISEQRPRWFIGENVPGLLSVNKGRDIQTVLDDLTQLGYVVDINILDSQEFGVPQRRRRVFLACVRLADLMNRKTDLLRKVLGDLAAQQLLESWDAIQLVSFHGQRPSDFASRLERYDDLHQKRTGLLEKALGESASTRSQGIWGDAIRQFMIEGENSSECSLTENKELRNALLLAADTSEYLLNEMGDEYGYMNTRLSWKNILDENWSQVNKFTTSTATSKTIDSTIFTFAATGLNIAASIIRWQLCCRDWRENCWHSAWFVLKYLLESMNYARQASSNLFIEDSLRDHWRNYLCVSSTLFHELAGCFGDRRSRQIPTLSESLPWDSPPSREAGAKVARCLATGTNASCIDGESEEFIAATLNSGGNSGGFRTEPGEHLVSHTLCGEGFDASEDGTGRGALIVPIAFQSKQSSTSQGPSCDDVSPTLDCAKAGGIATAYQCHGSNVGPMGTLRQGNSNKTGGVPFTFDPQGSGKQSNLSYNEDTVGTLGTTKMPGVAGFTVRRLTPRECERLQGFPDDWTRFGINDKGKQVEISDSARYRMLGNAVTVSVVEWIAKRIAKFS